MSGSSTFVQAQHAAELAVAAMALRSLFARELLETPEVVSLRFTVEAAGEGAASVDCEVISAGGMAIGGFSL
nr:hypothetical protein [uncultured Roseateles sp.]